MKFSSNNGTYEQYDISTLNDTDLEKFWRIIQDTWAYFFGEYIQCIQCNNIKGKKDVFSKCNEEYSQFTTEELEKKYNVDLICSQAYCGGKMEYIWGENYIQSLEKSLTSNIDANLIIYRNKTNEIVGLGYSYINILSKIYEQDLYFDFSINDLNKKNFNFDHYYVIPTGLSILERDAKYSTVMNIGKYMMMTYSDIHNKLPGILASLKGSGTDAAYKKNGAYSTDIYNPHNQNIELLVHENMIEEYKSKFSSLLKYNKK